MLLGMSIVSLMTIGCMHLLIVTALSSRTVFHYLSTLRRHPIFDYICIDRQTLISLTSDAHGPSICSPSNHLSSGIETTSIGNCWNGSRTVVSDIPAFEGNGITEQGSTVCTIHWHLFFHYNDALVCTSANVHVRIVFVIPSEVTDMEIIG